MPTPIIVAVDTDWTPARIGVGFIETEDGHGALRAAAALSSAACAHLRVVTAVEPMTQSSRVAPYGAGGRAESARVAQEELEAALADLPTGAPVSGEVVPAPAPDVLSELSTQVDLIVCGSRGYGPLRAVVAGSVSHALIRKAHCPVVVVPRGAENVLGELRRQSEATAG